MFHRKDHNNGSSGAFKAGLMGLALGAILGALFSPKSGKENRQALSDWMDRMNEDLNDKVKNTAEMTKDKYNRLVDEVGQRYRKLGYIKETELNDFIDELKMRWERIKDRWNE